jgi:cytochrome o ubiquinol oxidase operon protein cyoD
MSSQPDGSQPAAPESASPEEAFDAGSRVGEERVFGEPPSRLTGDILRAELRGYLLGLALAAALTAAAFLAVGTHLIYTPGIVMAIVVFGLAQVGVHLVFFLHLTTAPDNTNNVLALAFGVLIVCLIVFGTIWVMYNLDHNMIPAIELVKMRR